MLPGLALEVMHASFHSSGSLLHVIDILKRHVTSGVIVIAVFLSIRADGRGQLPWLYQGTSAYYKLPLQCRKCRQGSCLDLSQGDHMPLALGLSG